MSVVESDEAFCGNGIVEDGEECDCGYKEVCQDTCCNPRDNRISADADTLKCTLKIVNGVKAQCRWGQPGVSLIASFQAYLLPPENPLTIQNHVEQLKKSFNLNWIY